MTLKTLILVLATLSLLIGYPSMSAAQTEDYEILDVVLRYDGQQELGTLAAVVCNNKPTLLREFEVSITANDVTVTVAVERLPSRNCAHYFDAESTFATFGITAPQTITAEVRMLDASRELTVNIDHMHTLGPRSVKDRYSECRRTNPHSECIASIVDTPAADPHEVKLQKDQFFIISPVEHEVLVSSYLYDLVHCAANVGAYLGIDVPDWVTRRLLNSDGFSGSSAGGNVIMTSGTNETFTLHRANLMDWWRHLRAGGCLDPHEMTHVLLGDTPLPYWFNEGLATFMEDDSRSQYRFPMTAECLLAENSFVSNYYGSPEVLPYMNLMNENYDPTVPGIYYYWTGACLWVYLEQTYGADVIPKVVQELVKYQDRVYNGCAINPPRPEVYFIRDILTPILGEDITPTLHEMFGINELYTGCER